MNPSEISDPVAAADQDATALTNAARSIATFYRELVAQQMPPDEAGWLCRDWFNFWLESGGE